MHVRNEDVEEYRTSKLKNQMNEEGEYLSIYNINQEKRNEDVEDYRTWKLRNQMNEEGEDLSSK